MKATTAGLMPKCLQAESMECIFGVLRTSLVPLYTAIDEHDAITPILTKHVEGQLSWRTATLAEI